MTRWEKFFRTFTIFAAAVNFVGALMVALLIPEVAGWTSFVIPEKASVPREMFALVLALVAGLLFKSWLYYGYAKNGKFW